MSLTTPQPLQSGPAWLQEFRQRAAAEAATLPLPSATEELWRYSPINDLDLGRFHTVETPTPSLLTDGLLEQLTATPACVISLVDGHVVKVDQANLSSGVTISADVATLPPFTPLSSQARSHLDALHDAVAPAPLVIEIAAHANVEGPIVIISELVATSALTAPWVQANLHCVDAHGQVKVVFARFHGHDDLFQRTVACTFAQPIDRALDLTCTTDFHAGQ